MTVSFTAASNSFLSYALKLSYLQVKILVLIRSLTIDLHRRRRRRRRH